MTGMAILDLRDSLNYLDKDSSPSSRGAATGTKRKRLISLLEDNVHLERREIRYDRLLLYVAWRLALLPVDPGKARGRACEFSLAM